MWYFKCDKIIITTEYHDFYTYNFKIVNFCVELSDEIIKVFIKTFTQRSSNIITNCLLCKSSCQQLQWNERGEFWIFLIKAWDCALSSSSLYHCNVGKDKDILDKWWIVIARRLGKIILLIEHLVSRSVLRIRHDSKQVKNLAKDVYN